MADKIEPNYSALFRRLERRIDNNFDSQTKFLIKLIKNKSVNPYLPEQSPKNKAVEQKVAKAIYDKLKDLKLFPRRLGVSQYRPNVVCYIGPSRFRKSLILNGHMDTVAACSDWKEDPFSGKIIGGKLFGVGALDMKGSLSAYIFALQAILQEKVDLDGRLILMFVVDEESGASSKYGTSFLIRKGIKAKAGLIGEPGTSKIAIGNRGGYRFRLTTFGESVHTGRSAWERKLKGRNAILDMAKAIVALQQIELPYKPARAFPGRIPVFTFPTKIEGGIAVNMVPDRCSAEGDVRLMPGNSHHQTRIWIDNCLKEQYPDVVFEIEDLAFVPSVEISKTEEIVEKLTKNTIAVTGNRPKTAGAGPWNDAWMMITRDIPTVAGFGPDGDNAHAPDEYVKLTSLKAVTKIYARTVIEYLGIK